MVTLQNETEEELEAVLRELEIFFEPVTSELEKIINPEIKEEEAEEGAPAVTVPGGKKEEKKGAPPPKADPKKGGGKGEELAKYESALPLTSGGVESVVLLLDDRLMDLPLEALRVFRDVPAISRDFSLQLHVARLKRAGHNAALHNNHGLPKDQLKFIYDPPAPQAGAFREIVTEQAKWVAGSKWEGVLSADHVPSAGEWQRTFQNCSLFMYFSMGSLLHKRILEFKADGGKSECRAALVLDRMNSFKALVNKETVSGKMFANVN